MYPTNFKFEKMKSFKLKIASFFIFFVATVAFGLEASTTQQPTDNLNKNPNRSSPESQTSISQPVSIKDNSASSLQNTEQAISLKPSNLIDQGKKIGSLQKNDFSEVSRPFCTIYASSFHWWYRKITIWKDAETARCQYESFIKLSVGSIKEQMRTLENPPNNIIKGGINISTMDLKISTSLHPYSYIGNIKMHPEAEIRISLFDIIRNPKLIRLNEPFGGAYLPIPVREISYLRWDPGTQIRYIETDKKEVFVMTSFNTRIYPTLDAKDLDNLGTYLKLPEGWAFKTGKLTKILEFKSSNDFENLRMLDQFSNFYVKLDPASAL